jgi:signal peptidase I
MDKKFKEPLVSLLLSLVLPGLGQIFAGKLIKGAIFFLAVISLNLGLALYFLNPATKITVFGFAAVLISLGIICFAAIDAYFSAKKYNSGHNFSGSITPGKRYLLVSAMVCVLGIYFLAALFFQGNFYRLYATPPDAMEPTLYRGELVLVDLRAYKRSAAQRGDVVLYKYPQEPEKIYMHRIIGLPGESVLLKEQRVLINKIELKDDWALKIRHYNGGKLAKKGMPAVIVPENYFYVLGDNAARSQDSRYWGCLSKENLIGKVYKVCFPFNRSGPVK